MKNKIIFSLLLSFSWNVFALSGDSADVQDQLSHLKAEIGHDRVVVGRDSSGQPCQISLTIDQGIPAVPKQATLQVRAQAGQMSYQIDAANKALQSRLFVLSLDERTGLIADSKAGFYLKTVKLARGTTFEFRGMDAQGNFDNKIIICSVN